MVVPGAWWKLRGCLTTGSVDISVGTRTFVAFWSVCFVKLYNEFKLLYTHVHNGRVGDGGNVRCGKIRALISTPIREDSSSVLEICHTFKALLAPLVAVIPYDLALVGGVWRGKGQILVDK